MPEHWIHNDGGRAEAGFRGQTGDCVCRSIAIATQLPYQQVYDDLNALGRSERITKHRKKCSRSGARTGVHKPTIQRYMSRLGWRWTPTMHIGSGCRVHLRADELPAGRLVVVVSRHQVAVVDGIIHDTHDPTRDGTRCVYGYWSSPDA